MAHEAQSPPHNIAVAEVRHNGRIARITGSAATEADDAIQFIVDLMVREGVRRECVPRLYAELQPSHKWCDYIKANWPNALVTWSFAPGDDLKMDAAVVEILHPVRKPWRRFW